MWRNSRRKRRRHWPSPTTARIEEETQRQQNKETSFTLSAVMCVTTTSISAHPERSVEAEGEERGESKAVPAITTATDGQNAGPLSQDARLPSSAIIYHPMMKWQVRVQISGWAEFRFYWASASAASGAELTITGVTLLGAALPSAVMVIAAWVIFRCSISRKSLFQTATGDQLTSVQVMAARCLSLCVKVEVTREKMLPALTEN